MINSVLKSFFHSFPLRRFIFEDLTRSLRTSTSGLWVRLVSSRGTPAPFRPYHRCTQGGGEGGTSCTPFKDFWKLPHKNAIKTHTPLIFSQPQVPPSKEFAKKPKIPPWIFNYCASMVPIYPFPNSTSSPWPGSRSAHIQKGGCLGQQTFGRADPQKPVLLSRMRS